MSTAVAKRVDAADLLSAPVEAGAADLGAAAGGSSGAGGEIRVIGGPR
jgi:hypothetical protein